MTVHLVINERMCLRFVGVGRVIGLTPVFTCQLRRRRVATTLRAAQVFAARSRTQIYKFRRERTGEGLHLGVAYTFSE